MARYFDRINVMLAETNGEHLNKKGYVSEEKFDGTRCIIIKRGSTVRLFGRSWNEYTHRFPEIVKDGKRLKCNSCVIDSELTFFKSGRDYFLTALAKEETKKGYSVKCMVFDILELNDANVRELPLLRRKILLRKVIPAGLNTIDYVTFNTGDSHEKFFKKIVSHPIEGEGIMLKKEDSTYQSRRSFDWIKVKGWKAYDCVILGITYGQGARASTFGSLLLGRWDSRNKRFVYMGKTSGFSDSELNELNKKLGAIKSESKPTTYIVPPRIYQTVKFWVHPRYVAEVKYQELTTDRILRFPAFLRIRTDKVPTDCV